MNMNRLIEVNDKIDCENAFTYATRITIFYIKEKLL